MLWYMLIADIIIVCVIFSCNKKLGDIVDILKNSRVRNSDVDENIQEAEMLSKNNELYEKGIISKDEYESKKKELLSNKKVFKVLMYGDREILIKLSEYTTWKDAINKAIEDGAVKNDICGAIDFDGKDIKRGDVLNYLSEIN